MMNSHTSDNEKNYLIEEGKKIGIHGLLNKLKLLIKI